MNNIIRWYLRIGAAHLVARLACLAIFNKDDPLIKIYNEIDGEGKSVAIRKAGFLIGGAVGLLRNVVLWPVYDICGMIDGIKMGIDLIKKDESAE